MVTENRTVLAEQAQVKVELSDSFGRKQQVYISLLADPAPQEVLLAAIKTQMESEEATIAANLAAMNP